MSHERNVAGLKQSAQQRHLGTCARAEAGIQSLITAQRPINFNAVHEVSGVSTAWLYRHMKERIAHLRDQSSTRPTPAPKTRASDGSKDAIITTLRERLKKLEAENRALRQQLEVAYGQLYQQF
jgi:predicted DNA-binding transcriptional regulator AlpA